MAYIEINGNRFDWEDYLKLNRDLCVIKLLPEDVNGIASWGLDNKKTDMDKNKEYTKHVLIERTLTVNRYEFNFIDIETKEFYWSYYSDELDYNIAKESFLNKISGKVKFYLEE